MTTAHDLEAARATIASYRARTASADVVALARTVVTAAAPTSPERAKALLFAAVTLGSFGESVGLALHPEVLWTPSVIERLVITGHFSAPTRRTLRTNLRFLARAAAANPTPGPVPLARERAKAPYTSEQLAAYFALAHHQPTTTRRARAEGLLALGVGAGLVGSDLRHVRGSDVHHRSRGLVVEVRGRRARVVPVLARYHDVLIASADVAGSSYVVGGRTPERHNVTTPLISRLSGGRDLPRLEVARLRSTWLVTCAELIGLKSFMDAAGVSCTQRLGDLVAEVSPRSEEENVALLGGRR